MNFDSLCAARLKTERSRLALKQGDVAELCGVSREMWSKYERGIAVPGGDVLASFAAIGANVQFILVGESNTTARLSVDEEEIIEHYRAAPLAVKSAVLAALMSGTTNTTGKQINVSGRGHRVAGRDYREK
ncbi:helix-turn-helix domain-containing protein [Serratia bockelmannii]|uniref:helix-turn-helix domain-containing protein n=1 Tax=Serratia bockelmannii TaxID=2703793 RepID=UPI003E334618